MDTTLRRVLLIGMATALSVSALLGILVVLMGDFGGDSARVLGTSALVGLFSVLALPAGVLLDQGRNRSLARLALGLDALAFLLIEAALWNLTEEWKPALVVTLFAAALAELCTLQARSRPGESQTARLLVVVASTLAIVLALLLSAAVLDFGPSSGSFQLVAVVAIANFLLVLLQPIFRRLGEEPQRPVVAPAGGGHRLLLVVDRLPRRDLPGYVARPGSRGEIECAFNGSHDFAGAVAEAIRTLESEGSLVARVERLG